ncbi:MFS transporter [Penicillium sp. IBT 16267x]|nr:MFS transporter [Penicillium sp. IBT 16267x]
MAVKSSILVFYLNLTKQSAGSARWVRIATYITLVFVNVAGFTLTCLFTFGCHPLSVSLNLFAANVGQCLDQVILYVVSAPINLVTNIAIFLIPLPLLTALRLPRKQKIILLLTFSTGLFVISLSVLRIVFLQSVAVNRATAVGNRGVTFAVRYDISWSSSYIFLWSALEVDLEIICGCVPLLKPLIGRLLPRMIRNPEETSKEQSSGKTQSTSQETPSLQVVPTYVIDMQPGVAHPSRSGASSALNRNNISSQDSASIDQALSSVQMSPLAYGVRMVSTAQAMTPLSSPITSPPRHERRFSLSSQRTKSLLTRSNRESIRPILLVGFLFLFRGFAYGFFDILNARFRMAAGYPRSTSFELHAAQFAGYAVGPLLVARPLMKRLGMKWTFITGLAIYACGTLIFWPAATVVSLPTFYVSNFLVGFGMAVLDTGINLFVCLCGPMEWAEIRLNLVRGCQSAAALASTLLCDRAFFVNVNTISSLVNVQWAYLGMSLVSIVVFTVYYYLPIPEAPDDELKDLAHTREADFSGRVCGVCVVWATLAIGTFSLFCFFGARECLNTTYQTSVKAKVSNPSPPVYGYLALQIMMFTFGQLLTALAQVFVKPRWTLPVLYTGSIVFAVLCMDVKGYAGITMSLLFPLFLAAIFGTTYTICIRGMGGHTKTAAAILMTAVSGGAPFPVIQNVVRQSRGESFAYCVIVALCAAGAPFAIYVNVIPAARRHSDPGRKSSGQQLSSQTLP